MNDQSTPAAPQTAASIAHLWEYPELTLAIFGMQAHSPLAYALYETAGIQQQMAAALAQADGLLCVRQFAEERGGMQLQYWRSHNHLAHFARQMPHMQWWKWVHDHRGSGVTFYHEIYQCRTAEAIFEHGTLPLGPATFCTITKVVGGEGRSQERQQRFLEAVEQAHQHKRAMPGSVR